MSAQHPVGDLLHECVDRFADAVSVFAAVRDAGGRIVDFRWVYVNAAQTAITGYDSEALVGRRLLEVLPDHGPNGMLDVYRRVVETGDDYVRPALWYDDPWAGGPGHRRALSVRATKLHDGFFVVSRDVTHELGLLTAQRLESLGSLAGGMAHEFNNLLGAVVNYAAFVAEDLQRAEDEGDRRWSRSRGDLEQIRRACDRAASLTRQLLSVGRRHLVQPVVLDLNDVVRAIVPALGEVAGPNVTVATTLASGLRRCIADRGQLEQVLTHLAANAGHAMPGGGTLTLSTANLDVDEAAAAARPGSVPGRFVQLRVTDDGMGMSRDVAARAFEPFFSTKAVGDGPGLGLAVVYGALAQAGGHAEIESAPGRGTTVTCVLPATDDEPPGRPPHPTSLF